VIADVVVRKFVDGLPLYRQEVIYARDHIDLSRQTMSGWMIQLHERLTPLMTVMKQLLYQGRVIHIDETRLQVLNEPGRENTQLSYMWVYGGGPPDKPVIWYQYADTRSGDVPVNFLFPTDEELPACEMYLVTDGYEGYNALSKVPAIVGHGACWAHVRRRFVEATHGRNNTAAAHQMVALIAKLYQVERTARDKSPQQRKVLRQKKAVPVLDKIKAWLDHNAPKVLPKSPLGTAISYTLKLWPGLTIYIEVEIYMQLHRRGAGGGEPSREGPGQGRLQCKRGSILHADVLKARKGAIGGELQHITGQFIKQPTQHQTHEGRESSLR